MNSESSENESQNIQDKSKKLLTVMSESAFTKPDANIKPVFGGRMSSSIVTSRPSIFGEKSSFSNDKIPILNSPTIFGNPTSLNNFNILEENPENIFGGQTSSNIFNKPDSKHETIFGTNEQIKLSFNVSKSIPGKAHSIFAENDSLDEILGIQTKPISPIKKDPTTLIAIDVPNKYLDKAILINHFEKFGQVNKIMINQKSNQAKIYYADHNSALNAKNNGKKLHPNLAEMKLLFIAPMQTVNNFTPMEVKTNSTMLNPKLHSDNLQRCRSSSPSFASSSKKQSVSDIKTASDIGMSPKPQTTISIERYAILEARDKHIRNKQAKVFDVCTAQYLAASCPDMCPEKERYVRHVQNDLSPFEMTEGKLDHKLVVKQFSRSSADKEEPLPFELRPGNVLKMTMDYLLCNIVDKINNEEISAEVWYYYMWNRTRALRNDLMQQHLVDYNALYVIERCIRFHIHCSHEYCENSTDMDPKMNDEHLSKSLQSLKEIYHDMSEINEFSVAEPEFRGYEILLNLSQGDIFFRYQKFRESVRNSQPVQFAVKVLHALHSNNYVKFFSLLQSSSYLQGCILHKYYKVTRIKAMKIIVKGFTLPNKSQYLPKNYLKKMLGIIEDSELKEFVECFGLSFGTEGKTVKINRLRQISLDSYNIRKDAFILTKRKVCVSEIINGGSLPVNPLLDYKPHSSFTALGLLTEKARDASDQTSKRSVTIFKTPIKSDDELETRLLIRTKIMYEMNLIRKCFHNWLLYVENERIINRVKKSHLYKLERKYFNKWRCFIQQISQLKQKADIFCLSRYFKKWQHSVTSSKDFNKYQLEAMNQRNVKLVIKYVTLWKAAVFRAKRKKNMIANRELFLSRKYVMAWQSIVITSRVMAEAKVFFEHKLIHQFFSNWRDWIVKRKLDREKMHKDYPAMVGSMSIEQQNKKWNWGYERETSENVSALYVADLSATINRSLNGVDAIELNSYFTCLPFLSKFQNHIDNKLFIPKIINQFIKLYVYISPDLNPNFVKWIRVKFNISQNETNGKLNEHCDIYSQGSKCKFSIVIVEADDIFGGYESLSLMVAFCSIRDIHKYNHLITSSKVVNKLLICESSRVDFNNAVWQLSLHSLRSSEISSRLFDRISTMWNFLVANSKLTIANCNIAFNEALSCIVLNPVQKIFDQRVSFGSFKMPPSIVLNLYNEFIDHFGCCVQNGFDDVIPPEIINDSDFSSILNSDLGMIVQFIKSLKLEPFFLEEFISWEKLLDRFSTYCTIISEDWHDDLKSEIFFILETIKENIIDEYGNVNVFSIPWIDIIFQLISYKSLLLDESIILYDAERLANFRPTENYLSYLKIYAAPQNYKSQDGNLPKQQCPNKKRKPDELSQVNLIKKKKKTNFLLELADEKAKFNELRIMVQSEIELCNLNK